MRYSIYLFTTLVAASSTSAAFTPLGTIGDDSQNYGSFTGTVLDSVTLNGTTYTTDKLIQIELTAFRGATNSVLLQAENGPSNPTSQQRLDFLETDWTGDTGIINPSTNSDSVTANFNIPVVNIAGPDMFLYEINPTGADAFQIRINGTQLTVSSSDYGDSGAITNNSDVLQVSGGTPTTLNAMLTSNASVGSADITQSIVGVGIDFSDFGVALGDTISSFSFNSNGATTFDPVIIAAVPEPQAYAMLAGIMALALVAIRRRT